MNIFSGAACSLFLCLASTSSPCISAPKTGRKWAESSFFLLACSACARAASHIESYSLVHCYNVKVTLKWYVTVFLLLQINNVFSCYSRYLCPCVRTTKNWRACTTRWFSIFEFLAGYFAFTPWWDIYSPCTCFPQNHMDNHKSSMVGQMVVAGLVQGDKISVKIQYELKSNCRNISTNVNFQVLKILSKHLSGLPLHFVLLSWQEEQPLHPVQWNSPQTERFLALKYISLYFHYQIYRFVSSGEKHWQLVPG